MQTPIFESTPPSRCKWTDGWIGSHACNTVVCKQGFDLGSKPAWMSRLERGRAVVVLAQPVEEIRLREGENSAGAG